MPGLQCFLANAENLDRLKFKEVLIINMYLNNQIIVLANSKINCHRSAQMQTDMRNPKWFQTVRVYLINAYAM